MSYAAADRGDPDPALHHFAIDQGVLTKAIQQLSQQADVQILTSIDTNQTRTGSIRGTMSTEQALAMLLKGLPIEVRRVAGGYILDRSPPQPAQAAELADVEQIVVTGFRESLLRAIDLKHSAVGSQDSIVAEDIAAFPDPNLAESMQRIPGIAITRDSGEGRQITVRSLGPDFTRTQINGMEVLSNTASGMDNRGLVTRNRSFDFSLFASELFNLVTVQKSYAADEDEGGIAGTVQLSTAKPFDYDGLEMVLTAKGATNSNTDAVTPHVVGLISDRWGAFGALLSVAYSAADSNEYGYRNWGWTQVTMGSANIGPGISATDAVRLESSGADRLYAPQAETYSTWYDRRERLGITSSLQYRPGNWLNVELDLVYDMLTNHRDDYALAAAGTNGLTGDVTGTQLLNSIAIRGNTIVAANYSHVDLRSEYNVMQDSTQFSQVVFNASYEASDALTIRAMTGYSRSNYTLPVFDKVFLESQNHDFAFDFSNPERPVNRYGFDLTDPDSWNLMRLDTQENAVISDYVNGKIDFAWTMNRSSTLKFGAEYKKFLNGGWMRSDKVFHNTPADTPIPDDDKLVVPGATLAPYIVGDVDRTYATIGQIRNLTDAYDVPGSDYRVSEKTFAAYLQYDLNTALFGLGFRANAGLRYFATGLTSKGTLNTGTSLVPVAIMHNYNDMLPTANAALDLTDDTVLRFSANRNISRPALSDLAAAGTLTTAPFGGTISAGNPNLKPFMADSLEMSIEYYDDRSSYASLGVFYKNMENFITTMTTVLPYSATGYPTSFLLPGQSPNIAYNYTAPINGRGAVIVGLEAAVQQDFKFLPAPFDDFGFIGNLTYADGNSDVIYDGKPVSLPLLNLSKLSVNATLYYESGRWSIRVSDAYRDRYLDGAGGNANVGDGFKSTNNVDFAAHYRISDHLKATVEGINLTDQPIVQYTDVREERIEVVTRSGRTFTFGATYEF